MGRRWRPSESQVFAINAGTALLRTVLIKLGLAWRSPLPSAAHLVGPLGQRWGPRPGRLPFPELTGGTPFGRPGSCSAARASAPGVTRRARAGGQNADSGFLRSPPPPDRPEESSALSLLGPQQAHNLPQVGAFWPALDLRCWINPQTWPLFPVSPEMFGEGPGGSPWSNVPAVWPVWLRPPPDSSHPSLTRVKPQTALRPFPRGCLPEAASQGLVTVVEAPWLH